MIHDNVLLNGEKNGSQMKARNVYDLYDRYDVSYGLNKLVTFQTLNLSGFGADVN
ncbi:unnamed protein product [Schistosoma margrebowiei]|uniref:Uncharacterized protein n=1 Tax=Schistosoma margrebowiei TaxID=48269 RepID=A0A183LV22_9TREM|nr:unnamed protein product [Schistosoma margrebowiei]